MSINITTTPGSGEPVPVRIVVDTEEFSAALERVVESIVRFVQSPAFRQFEAANPQPLRINGREYHRRQRARQGRRS